MTCVEATAFLDPQGLIVASASRLADAILEHLQGEDEVVVSMAGIRGASSSYFNTVLLRVVEVLGDQAVHRIRFQFTTKAQEQIYRRSLDCVTNASKG